MRTPRSRHVRRQVLALAAVLGLALGVPVAAPASGVVTPLAQREPAPDQWWYDAMGLGEAHRYVTGKGVKVAIIDTALDTSVPELRGAKISFATDCYDKRRSKPVTGMTSDHGTAMTVGIVGQGNGGALGVAPDAEVRFYPIDADPDRPILECDSVLIAKQIRKAVDEGADIISMSLGAGDQTEELAYARERGVVVVMAAGASTEDSTAMALPAGLQGSFAVLASGSDGRPWSKNPVGLADLDAWPTISSPGIELQLGGVVEGRGWVPAAARTGTSGATALTAGTFALLKSRWPEATGNQLVQTVIHQVSGNDGGDLSYSMKFGYGRLAVLRALETDPTGYPDEYPLLKKNPNAVVKAYPASVYDVDRDESPVDPTGAETPEAGAGERERPDDDGGPSTALLVGGGVGLLAVLAAAAVLLARRRSVDVRRPASPR